MTNARHGRSRDLSARERRYLITMGVRIACLIGMAITPGVWRWVLLAGAAFLPAIAVVLANVIDKRGEGTRSAPPEPEPLALSDRSVDVVSGEVVEDQRR
ncbi:DUF3099 domain-containing protein [Naumannella sp. ID2617S]|nr:DUF3099 domain-containing protein [Naumannella sp. ID2617S]